MSTANINEGRCLVCRNKGQHVALTFALLSNQFSLMPILYLLLTHSYLSLLSETPDNVFVRIPDQMVEGVDYQLVCHIIRVAPVQNLKVKWYHGSEVVEVHTFNDTATAPVNVSSVLKVSDERGHNGERFSCEAELDLGPNGPQPVLRVLAEAPYPAVVHCEYCHLWFRGCISRRHLCGFDLFKGNQIDRSSENVHNILVD